MKTKAWYIAHEILSFEMDDRAGQEECLIWENLILIQAVGAEEAYEKAMAHGKLHDSPIKIDEKSGRCIFKGLKDLVFIYDELEDGAELEWKRYQVDWENLDALITPKEELHAFAPPLGSTDSAE
jgi:Domain of unknown function (DUF4288)